jgi:hypothetical protein
MDSGSRFLTITAVVVLALILQVFLVIADTQDSPEKAAVEFAKAYYMLEPAMAKRLCEEIIEDEDLGVIEDYLWRMEDEARKRGFERNWMKFSLSHVETETELIDDTSARVRLTFAKRRSINPVFAAVAGLFNLGETQHGEANLSLVKENDRWKVCGEPLNLIEG